MTTATYQILDEPQPSKLSHLAVRPLWPLLAVMFGGTWISWPWFVVNAFAVGSPTRIKELLWAVGGFVGTVLLLFGLLYIAEAELVAPVIIQYLLVFLIVWKLTVSYWLYLLQARTFALYEHFGGIVRSGLMVVLVGFFLQVQLIRFLTTGDIGESWGPLLLRVLI